GLLGIAFLSLLTMYAFRIRHQAEPEVIGVSFSQYQAEQYGIDWRDAYRAVIDELGFKHLRIAAYWDRIEPVPDKYDFSETDWMIEEAAQRGAKVKLVIGQKLIRVPECFYPTWLDRNNPELVEERVNRMLTVVVERYRNNPTVEAWQLENEYLLRTFGDCPNKNFTQAKLAREITTVRSADQSKPIIITQSDQMGWPIAGPTTEYYGFSMYRTTWNKAIGYFRYPQGGWFNWWKGAVIETYRPTKVIIHELQAEAWGKVGNQYLDYDEARKSMNPEKFRDNIAYARATHIKRFDLWGAEWWYWLKVKQNQPEMWEAVRSLKK
ncbi:beta-galactosidase, partial [Candidatus Saccharibacteria bacterium]|nr:beta-galactosidase [Candidatus Saccharibacteria bacterium]